MGTVWTKETVTNCKGETWFCAGGVKGADDD